MTYREFLSAVISAEISEEMTTFAKEAVAKLDKRNADRAAKPSKTALANEPIKQAILGILSATPMTASEIADALDISVQKASALCRQLVDAKSAVVTDVKIPKKGTQKAYSLPTEGEVEEPAEVADSE